MKIRILSILLVVLMLFTTVATMSGCSYTFRNKRYADDLPMLNANSYKNMDISVSLKADDYDFLQAKYGIGISLDQYIEDKIKDSLRSLTYKDANSKTVSFMGTDKPLDQNLALEDDATVYYLISYTDTEKDTVKHYYNLATVAGAKEIGSGNLYGVNFEKALVEQGIGAEGTRGELDAKTSGYIYTSYKHMTDNDAKTESEGYDVWYITFKLQKVGTDNVFYTDANGVTYDGKTAIRVDMKNVDLVTGTCKPEAKGVYPDELCAIIKEIVDVCNSYEDDPDTDADEAADKGRFKIGQLAGELKEYQIGEDKYDASMTINRAQKEVFSTKEFEVTLDSSSKVISTDIVGKKVSVKVIVTEIKEYNINACIDEFIREAGWKFENGAGDFKKLLTALDSSFKSETEVPLIDGALTDESYVEYQKTLVKEYKDYIKTSNSERIDSELIKGAKDAMFQALVAIAKAEIAEDAYPSKAVKECYNESLNNMKVQYNAYYTTAYDSFERFAAAQYGVSVPETKDGLKTAYKQALEKLEEECRDIVLEKMVIMRLAGIMGITVTKDEYNAEVKRLEELYEMTLYYNQMLGGTDAETVVEFLGGEESIYIAMYYSRVMEKVYSTNFKSVDDINKTRADS